MSSSFCGSLTLQQSLTPLQGTQFHAEYQSKVLNPSVSPSTSFRPNSLGDISDRTVQKPYLGFIAASAGVLEKILKEGLGRSAKLTNGVNGAHHF